MGTTRGKFTSEFKKKVVLEALKKRNTLQELAANMRHYDKTNENFANAWAFRSARFR
jgi:hypothetical protein